MDPVVVALLQSWTLDPWLIALLVIVSATYGRGWWWLPPASPALRIWDSSPSRPACSRCFWPWPRPWMLAELLLQVHMIQHLVLMMVVPPLLWLGAPVLLSYMDSHGRW